MTSTLAPPGAAPLPERPRSGAAPTAVPAPPAHRDRFVDALRVFAIALVVLQHWLMPVLAYSGGELVAGNALASGHGWTITWISQVMPLVFFAGGAAAAFSLRRRARAAGGGRRHGSDATWAAGRVRRLAVPVLALAAVWLPLPHALLALGLPAQPVQLGARLVGALLWFLVVYVLISVLGPVLVRWADRWRGREVVVLAAAAVAVDVVRFGAGLELVGYLNALLVWGAVHQVGIHYGSGALQRVRGLRAAGVAVAGFGVVTLGVAYGPYPASMIGMPGAEVSNMNPPTAVLLALAAGQLGLALLLRPLIVRLTAVPAVARRVDRVSASMMTTYLWHTPALVLVAGIAVLALGRATPEPLSLSWWDGLPFWLLVLLTVVFALVAAFERFEGMGLRAGPTSPRRLAVATVLVAAGLLGLTVHGFAPEHLLHPTGPLASTAALATGVLLLGTWPRTARTGRVEP